MQPPVRIKVYGSISLTKRTYLIWAGLAALGLLALLAFWFVTVGEPTPAERAGLLPPVVMIWRRYGPWIIAAGFLIGALEAFFVLRRFRRAEAERQQPGAPATTPRGS
jgi:hypothetical protein